MGGYHARAAKQVEHDRGGGSELGFGQSGCFRGPGAGLACGEGITAPPLEANRRHVGKIKTLDVSNGAIYLRGQD